MYHEQVGFFGRTYDSIAIDVAMNREQTQLEALESEWVIVPTKTATSGAKAVVEAIL